MFRIAAEGLLKNKAYSFRGETFGTSDDTAIWGDFMFRFIHPYWLLLLPVIWTALPVLAIQAAVRRRRKLEGLLGADAGDPAAVKFSPARRWWRWFFLLMTASLLLLAAARPYRSSKRAPFEPKGRDFVVLFDVSKSMLATDIAPSRLEHAKFLLRELSRQERGDRFGLVAFAGNAYLSCPLTADPTAFGQYIDELSPDAVPVGGTNLELALSKARQAFKAAAGGNRAIILLTDGDELTGDSSHLIGELKRHSIPLFVIGLGDPDAGAPVPDGEGGMRRDSAGKLVVTRLNEKKLRQLALGTGGIYVRSSVTDTGLKAIERRIAGLDAAARKGATRRIPVEDFPVLLLLAGVFWIAYLLLSERPGCHRNHAAAALLLLLFLTPGASGAPKNPAPIGTPEAETLPAPEKPRPEIALPQNSARLPSW